MASVNEDGGVGVSERPATPLEGVRSAPRAGRATTDPFLEGPGPHPDAPPEDVSQHDEPHAPDLTVRLYVGVWLPAAGAFLAAAVLRGSYWAAFIGVELLLVGWFTLAKL